MKRSKPKTFFTSSEEYLYHFFVQILLMVVDAPNSLLDELEQAIKLAREKKAEMQERLDKLEEQKHD